MSIDFTRSDPLYQQIVDDIREQITDGSLAIGERIGSHRELAEKYGVSLITVKKALTELIREGLLYARVGKGTFVARTAPQVNHEKHRTIGVVLRDLTVPFFSDIVQQVEAQSYKAGYNMMLAVSSGQIEKEERQIERFRHIGVDGVIIASMEQSHQATATMRALHEAGFPYAMVSYVDDPDMYMVGIDHEQGAFLATSHLVEQGATRIAYLGANLVNRLSELREQGYRRALEAHNLPLNDAFVYRILDGPGWERMKSGYEAGLKIINDAPCPDAIFVYNDIAALGLQRAILEAGLNIPEDIALIGFDDIEQASYAVVPLSTVRQHADRISEKAVEMVLRQIAQRDGERRIVVEPELVLRASSLRSEVPADEASSTTVAS